MSSSSVINFHALGARLHSSFKHVHRRSPLLLILDLHGVLVQRIAQKEREMLVLTRRRRPRDMRHNKHDIWLRPFLRQFLTIISARHNVAIWSAAQPRTVIPLLDEFSQITELQPPFKKRCTAILDRSKCRPDYDKRNGSFSVIKYLPDLWNEPLDPSSSPAHETSSANSNLPSAGQFNERNTIIIDDTFSKVRHHPNSAIVLPEYNVFNYHFTYDNDDTLLWLLLYLEYLIEGAGLESYDQHGQKDPNQPDIISCSGIDATRPTLYSFENFWTMGFHEAFEKSSPYQRESYKSLAYVYFPNELIEDLPEPANSVNMS